MFDDIPDKTEDKNTTSLKFKKDLFNFFKNKKLKNILEIGSNHGWTTRILSDLGESIYSIDNTQSNIEYCKKNNPDKNNINWICGDAYANETYLNLPKYFDLVFIDCIHEFQWVIADINRALSFRDPAGKIYLAFDDYAHPISTGVFQAVNEAVKHGLKIEQYIGEGEGFEFGKDFTRRLLRDEGLILSYEK